MKKLLFVGFFLPILLLTMNYLHQAAAAEKVVKPAWQQEWDRTVAAAKQEGRLVVAITGGPELRQLFSQGMKEKFGITLEFVTGKGAELAEKIGAERRAGLFLEDVYVGGGTTLISVLKPSGALAALRPLLLLPEVLDDKAYFDNRLPFVDKEKTYILVFGPAVANTLAVNTSIVKAGEIKGNNDLLNPQWKDKIVLFEPQVAGTGNEWFFITANKMGLDYHRRLVKQNPLLTRDKRLQVEWVAKGKYAIAIAPSKESFAQFQKIGAPIDWVPAADLSYLTGTGSLAFYDKAPHPNAARVFINWLMTKETLTKWSKLMLMTTARKDVLQDFLEPETRRDANSEYFDLNTEDAVLKMTEFNKFAKQIYGPLLK